MTDIKQVASPLKTKTRVQVIEAIRELNFKVVPEDIAVKKGLPLLVVTEELNAIASETRADLKVNNLGKIQYLFKPSFEEEFLKNALKSVSTTVSNAVINIVIMLAKAVHLVALTVFRASVGILMIASVVAVVIFIIISILKRLEHTADGAVDVFTGEGGGLQAGILLGLLHFFRFFITDWIYDWWFWDRYYIGDYKPNFSFKKKKKEQYYIYSDSYWVDSIFDFSGTENTVKKVEEKSRDKRREEEQFDFLTICFQFVFGPGNPNKDLEERNWKNIAAIIRNNQGVIIAEQIAPYMDIADVETDSEYWMFPVLNRFHGIPEVSDNGDIKYIFPQFRPQISNQTPKSVPFNKGELDNLYKNSLVRKTKTDLPQLTQEQISVPEFKKEELVPFMDFDSNRLFGAILMALIELCGSIYLFIHINSMPWLLPYKPLIFFMMIYGCLFLTIPVARYFSLQILNKEREARNTKRFDAYARLVSPDKRLKTKLKECVAWRNSADAVTVEELETAYTTEKDVLEQ